MKVHISFERPSSFVLKLDSIQQAAFERWQKAHEHADSFHWNDLSEEADAALLESNRAWDRFIDSIDRSLEVFSSPVICDVIDVTDMAWGAVNP